MNALAPKMNKQVPDKRRPSLEDVWTHRELAKVTASVRQLTSGSRHQLGMPRVSETYSQLTQGVSIPTSERPTPKGMQTAT